MRLDSSVLLLCYGGNVLCCFDSIGMKTQRDKLRVSFLAQQSLGDMAGVLARTSAQEGKVGAGAIPRPRQDASSGRAGA